MKTLLTAILILSTTACSTTSDQLASNDTDNNDAVGYRCDKAAVTGSSIPKDVCTTAAQREEEKQKRKQSLGCKFGNCSKAITLHSNN